MKRSILQTVVLGTLVCCTTQAADKHEMLLSMAAPKPDLRDEAGRTSYGAQEQSAESLLRQVAFIQQQDVQDREIDDIRPSLDYAWGDVPPGLSATWSGRESVSGSMRCVYRSRSR